MKSAWASLFLAALVLQPALGKSRHCMLRVHAEANAQDTAVFSTAIRAQLSGKTVAIEKMPRLSENDVVAFRPYPLGNGNYGVLFQFDDHGRLALDTLSVERRGGFVFVFINGRAITELQIDKRISDGKIYLASGLSADDIARMKKDWRMIGQRHR